ncbi:MAG: UDP-N-acetylmuramate dehydrogenase [Thermacetogeniaceae bacterium]
MNWEQLARDLQAEVAGRVMAGASMKQYTTWRIGGPADLLLIPQAEDDVVAALEFTRRHDLPLTVIGNGSNLLVGDSGIRGLTLRIGGGLQELQVGEKEIVAGAGVFLPTLSRAALRGHLSGLEFGGGIPASLGGALIMNAGAFGQSIGASVRSVDTIDYKGARQTWKTAELEFDYRYSTLQLQALIIVKASLELQPAKQKEIRERFEYYLEYRSSHHPLDQPSAGSVFRNPSDQPAGQLIEMAGLKGFRVGDAQVSVKHANFIMNLGSATATQVRALIEIIRERVLARFGIDLETEVRVVGEER